MTQLLTAFPRGLLGDNVFFDQHGVSLWTVLALLFSADLNPWLPAWWGLTSVCGRKGLVVLFVVRCLCCWYFSVLVPGMWLNRPHPPGCTFTVVTVVSVSESVFHLSMALMFLHQCYKTFSWFVKKSALPLKEKLFYLFSAASFNKNQITIFTHKRDIIRSFSFLVSLCSCCLATLKWRLLFTDFSLSLWFVSLLNTSQETNESKYSFLIKTLYLLHLCLIAKNVMAVPVTLRIISSQEKYKRCETNEHRHFKHLLAVCGCHLCEHRFVHSCKLCGFMFLAGTENTRHDKHAYWVSRHVLLWIPPASYSLILLC